MQISRSSMPQESVGSTKDDSWGKVLWLAPVFQAPCSALTWLDDRKGIWSVKGCSNCLNCISL